MTAVDRLDEIAARLTDPMVTYKENVTEDAPALVAALRAVVDVLDRELAEPYNPDSERLAERARAAVEVALGAAS